MVQTIKLVFLAMLVVSTSAAGLLDIAGKVLNGGESSPLKGFIGLLTNTAQGLSNVLGGDLKTKIAEIKGPVARVISNIGSSICTNLKKVAGKHMEGTQSPDFNQLTLNFISAEMHTTLTLGSMAQSLLRDPGFNPRQPIVIFMHGFIDDPTKNNYAIINEAFQDKGHYNIFALDASSIFKTLYLRSSTYVRDIGEKLGETLAELVYAGLDPRDIHLVGHSLGSHVSGFAGKTFYELMGTQIGRITGLDPSGPCFSDVKENLRLQAADAMYVDVIHTNGGVLGLQDPIGHADFFPNGGEMQPNCLLEFCSHNRAVELFAESVRQPDAFLAVSCRNWQDFLQDRCSENVSLMGYNSMPRTRGLFYLRTNDEKPYGLGMEGLSRKKGFLSRLF